MAFYSSLAADKLDDAKAYCGCMTDLSQVRALTFDVFGTVVDWRSSVIREVEAAAAGVGVEVDAPRRAQHADREVGGGGSGFDAAAMADDWRAGYPRMMQEVREGKRAWDTIDALHRVILEELIPKYGLDALSEDARDDLNRAWHRLDPWPDAVEGLTRLKSKYVIAPLSNGNVALLVNMAKRGGLPWDAILSAELFGHFKADPEVYRGAARLLGLAPEQVMMVAAHAGDLRAAASHGLRTAYVPRPLEWGPDRPPAGKREDDRFDVEVGDFLELGVALGE